MPTPHVNPQVSTVPPWAVNERIGTSAARYALDTVLMPRTDAGLSYIDYDSGVMASGDGSTTHLAMLVTPAENAMQVTVAQGNCVINTRNQGAYMCCLDSEKTIEVPASSATAERYDLVVACVYDDENSALAGEQDVRQFAVELVQGDESTSTPMQPQAPPGAIPLASIHIGQGATNLLGTDPHAGGSCVHDLRGPGLVARGGMRVLYGADAQPGATAYERPGAYPGDQRWVHTNHFQHQVYYGSGDDPTQSGWRGVHNALVYNARPPDRLRGTWALRTGTQRILCQVEIPYPGTPFMVYPTAIVRAQMSARTAVDHSIRIGAADGPTISSMRVDSGPFNSDPINDSKQGWNLTPVMWGIFTEATTLCLVQTVVATSYSGDRGGVGFHPQTDDHRQCLLSVVVYPSTVAPPIWQEEQGEAGGGEERPEA